MPTRTHISLGAFKMCPLLFKRQMRSSGAAGSSWPHGVGPGLPRAAWLEWKVCPEGMGGAETPAVGSVYPTVKRSHLPASPNAWSRVGDTSPGRISVKTICRQGGCLLFHIDPRGNGKTQ